jgi:hypothetical protein
MSNSRIHPVGRVQIDSTHFLQRLVLPSSGSKPVGTVEKILLPGRAVARTGLRMMPTFPPLPLKVGSRSGAVSLRFRLPGAPRFLWEWTH